MSKVSGKIEESDDAKLWLLFMRADTKEELEMLKEAGNNSVDEAVDAVFAYNMDDDIWWEALREKMRRHDEASALHNARKQGIAQGMKKGIAQGKKEGIAQGIENRNEEIEKKLQEMHYSDEQIYKILN